MNFLSSRTDDFPRNKICCMGELSEAATRCCQGCLFLQALGPMQKDLARASVLLIFRAAWRGRKSVTTEGLSAVLFGPAVELSESVTGLVELCTYVNSEDPPQRIVQQPSGWRSGAIWTSRHPSKLRRHCQLINWKNRKRDGRMTCPVLRNRPRAPAFNVLFLLLPS